ncbi:MAG: flavin reductase family protein [Ruminococcaceae bacterium]|nr:flavin reductase family protein [Oscillospiraceae bacterium]
MRKNFGPKTVVYPMPVFIISTYDKSGTPNAMNAAWGGISEEKEITICISDDHKTAKNLLETNAFCVSMATSDYVKECDYLGIVSGNQVNDKLSKCGFHTYKSEFVNAPIIEELPMTLECKVKSYDSETCCLVGEIVNVCADESIITDGKIDVCKLKPITYDSMTHGYFVLGEKVGNAFSDGKKIK